MLSDRAKSTEHSVWTVPRSKLCVDDLTELGERWEVLVMKPESAEQFPNPFDWIKLGTVRRKEKQDKVGLLGAAPSEMEVGMVILGIVDDDDDLATATTGNTPEFTQEAPTGLGVKATFGLGGDQPAVCDSDRAEVADAFACRRMMADRIANLRRDPHPAATAVLLKMNFIHRPELNLISPRQALEFFLRWPALAGRLEQLSGGVCADGTRVVETAVGIAGRVARCQTSSRGSSIGADRPKAAPAIHSRRDSSSEPPPLVSSRPSPTVTVGLDPPARSAHRSRPSRNEKPSLPPSHVNPQGPRLPAGSSFPRPQAAPRATDGRSVHRGCVESRPAMPGSSLPGPISSVLSCTDRLSRKPTMSN